MSHEPAPLVFLDTETTGLERDADIWEFAAIRREPDGSEETLHLFIEHDWEKCARLPEAFKADHLARFPGHNQHTGRRAAAHQIERFLAPSDRPLPHIVGAVPNFDTERISLLLRTEIGQHVTDPWHYHLIDVENLAVGALAATPVRVCLSDVDDQTLDELAKQRFSIRQSFKTHPEVAVLPLRPPWNSDDISHALGIDPDATGTRHTALADARWAMAIYDRVMGGSPT